MSVTPVSARLPCPSLATQVCHGLACLPLPRSALPPSLPALRLACHGLAPRSGHPGPALPLPALALPGCLPQTQATTPTRSRGRHDDTRHPDTRHPIERHPIVRCVVVVDQRIESNQRIELQSTTNRINRLNQPRHPTGPPTATGTPTPATLVGHSPPESRPIDFSAMVILSALILRRCFLCRDFAPIFLSRFLSMTTPGGDPLPTPPLHPKMLRLRLSTHARVSIFLTAQGPHRATSTPRLTIP